ncbi:hypothetical protein EMIT0P2_20172 [Pseudomonas sp. IT-P2]
MSEMGMCHTALLGLAVSHQELPALLGGHKKQRPEQVGALVRYAFGAFLHSLRRSPFLTRTL